MTKSATHRKIGILGAGNIGQPIGRHWVAAGHTVAFGSRTPADLASTVEPWGERARAVTLSEAVDFGDVVVLTVPNGALEEVLATLGDKLRGKVVIDATNPIGRSEDGRIISILEKGLTEGRRTADLLPDSVVVRAFTHILHELLWSRGTRQPQSWGMAFAGDDAAGKAIAAELITDTGFTPVDIGGLDDSAPLDPGGAIFPKMFAPADLRLL